MEGMLSSHGITLSAVAATPLLAEDSQNAEVGLHRY